MLDVLEEKDTYLTNFAQFTKTLPANKHQWLAQLRRDAIERFATLGFPTTDDEEWRFTNIAPIAKTLFRLPRPAPLPQDLSRETLHNLAIGPAKCIEIVFFNGRFSKELSSREPLPNGVKAGSLAGALESDSKLLESHLARYAPREHHPFVALNTAFLEDGAFVHVSKGVALEAPIHLVFLTAPGAQPAITHPRNLILLEENSHATLIESYVSASNGCYFTNAVTEIVVGKSAVAEHYRLQRESTDAFHIATVQVQQDRGSNFTSHSLAFGGAIARTEYNAVLKAEGCETTLNGLYLAGGAQLIDNHTLIDHAKPHCASHELYKGILSGKARGVFNGKILVRQDAQKTDAKQTNKALLLSDDAQINTQPMLKIYADDVKCTHGATIGQLDKEALFYLRSRGIGEQDARALLTFAFANDVVSRMKCEPVRKGIEALLRKLLKQPANGGEAA